MAIIKLEKTALPVDAGEKLSSGLLQNIHRLQGTDIVGGSTMYMVSLTQRNYFFFSTLGSLDGSPCHLKGPMSR